MQNNIENSKSSRMSMNDAYRELLEEMGETPPKEEDTNINEKSQPTVSWWRYPAAILSFILVYFFLPALVGLALTITNWFTPEYFKSGELWIFIFSDIISAGIGFSLVDTLMLKQKYIFQAVWAAIVAIYSFFTAITNWILGLTELKQLLGVLAMGIVAFVFVGISCKKNAQSQENT